MPVPRKSDKYSPCGMASSAEDEPADAAEAGDSNSLRCPVCGYRFITRVDGKHKLRTRVLIFTKDRKAMGICPNCRAHLKVPVALNNGGNGF